MIINWRPTRGLRLDVYMGQTHSVHGLVASSSSLLLLTDYFSNTALIDGKALVELRLRAERPDHEPHHRRTLATTFAEYYA
jgi:hypothetical protein